MVRVAGTDVTSSYNWFQYLTSQYVTSQYLQFCIVKCGSLNQGLLENSNNRVAFKSIVLYIVMNVKIKALFILLLSSGEGGGVTCRPGTVFFPMRRIEKKFKKIC